MDVLTGLDALRLGLEFLKMPEEEQETYGPDKCEEFFNAAYGSHSEIIAEIWADLQPTLLEKERTRTGLKSFFMALYLLYCYPRNAKLIQVHFGPVGEVKTRGRPIWSWVENIASLFASKIGWHPRLDDVNEGQEFILSVDGVDFRTYERRDHPLYPIDRQRCSHKFKHAALKYQIALSISEDKIIWISQQAIGGVHDLTHIR